MAPGCLRKLPSLAIALAALAAPAASAAQTTAGRVALDQLEPAPTGDAFFGVPSPWIGGHLVPRGSVMFDYASRPLRIFGEGTETALVAQQGFVRADLSFALWNRVLVSAHLPILVLQTGEPIEGVTTPALRSTAAGDLRLGLRGRLFGGPRAPFQASLGGYLFAPTAPRDQYLGEGAVRGDLHAILGGRVGSSVAVVWSASAGIHLRASDNPHALRFGAGLGLLLLGDRLQLGAEAYGQRPLGKTTIFTSPEASVTSNAQTGLELLGSLRVRIAGGLVLGGAAGPGLLNAFGTPTFRAVALAGWSPPPDVRREKPKATDAPKANDRDGDGFNDDADACPDEKGELAGDPSKDGCPPPDRDKDSVLDLDDACPLDPGDRSTDAAKNGCPRDGDGDGVPDRDDACPKDAGLSGAGVKKRGCPADRDDDGVFDTLDACPDKPGIAASEPELRGCPEDLDGDGVKYPEDACPRERGAEGADKKGCPRFVRLEGDAVVLSQPVELVLSFRAKGEAVAPASMPVLEEIRELLRDHPEITRLEVQGHTDDAGDVKKKLVLSQKQAEIVMRALVAIGVPPEKLVATGYGHKRPIADNRLPEGMRKNRRIAFEVKARAK